MSTPNAIKRHIIQLVLVTAFAVSTARAQSVPYDLNQETYQTETLFSYDGCMDHRLMSNSGEPKVFKDHVYMAIVVHGSRPRILQIPLGSGEAKIGRLEPDYVIGEDSHQYFTLGIDKAGYIHLTGGMHGSPWKYWISAKPEDVSSFVRVDAQKQGPPGTGITYPHFFTDMAGNLFLASRGTACRILNGKKKHFHAGLLSTYDATSHQWRLLGADIPQIFNGQPGNPVTVWEDNFENGGEGKDGAYNLNSAHVVAGPDNTLHFCFTVLNHSPESGSARDDAEATHVSTDILYATSKDAGRTLQRVDGSQVLWPVRAEAGPYQPDVIYAAEAEYAARGNSGPFPWLSPGAKLELDWRNRPMIKAHKAGSSPGEREMVFRLENGKWSPCTPDAFGPWRDKAGVLMQRTSEDGQVVRLWDESHRRVVKLGPSDIYKLDEDYLRDTGTMIYTSKKPGAGNTVINILRTTIGRPGDSK